MSTSNLPPGVTDRMIDRSAGYYADCDNCGREVVADTLEDGVCPRCFRSWLDEDARVIGGEE